METLPRHGHLEAATGPQDVDAELGLALAPGLGLIDDDEGIRVRTNGNQGAAPDALAGTHAYLDAGATHAQGRPPRRGALVGADAPGIAQHRAGHAADARRGQRLRELVDVPGAQRRVAAAAQDEVAGDGAGGIGRFRP